MGRGRDWKWGVVEEFCPAYDGVVDVGCGDLSFWEDRDCKSYVGLDVACNVIEANRKKRPRWRFVCANARNRQKDVKGRIVFCFDLLFHIMDTRDFVKILHNLCAYSREWIFVYTWSINPFTHGPNRVKWRKLGRKVSDGKFQYYRPLRRYMKTFKNAGFALEATRWPPWGGIGEMFVFRKRGA